MDMSNPPLRFWTNEKALKKFKQCQTGLPLEPFIQIYDTYWPSKEWTTRGPSELLE